MLKFKETKSKEIKIIDLIPGQVFKYANRKYSFVRIKRGGKSMVITDILTEKDYSLKIHDILSSKQIIGKVTLTSKSIKETTSNKNKISIKDVKLNENVIIMTGRGNTIPQLYKLVKINNKNKYTHSFQNPITNRIERFKGNDNWEVYRLNDIIK